ncbi:hypothetical protein DFJ74DRAFT_650569 [Hyaloraphidium curvatum]|nr:hypothetical protein DFJ74DRAFT_650569 [Hyaloraphidium curvatum]
MGDRQGNGESTGGGPNAPFGFGVRPQRGGGAQRVLGRMRGGRRRGSRQLVGCCGVSMTAGGGGGGGGWQPGSGGRRPAIKADETSVRPVPERGGRSLPSLLRAGTYIGRGRRGDGFRGLPGRRRLGRNLPPFFLLNGGLGFLLACWLRPFARRWAVDVWLGMLDKPFWRGVRNPNARGAVRRRSSADYCGMGLAMMLLSPAAGKRGRTGDARARLDADPRGLELVQGSPAVILFSATRDG